MWLKPQGYATIVSPGESEANLDGFQRTPVREGVNEFDTMSCGHCRRVTHVQAGMRPEDIGGLCRCCMRPICPQCVGEPCDVIEKKLERDEAHYEALRSYGLIA